VEQPIGLLHWSKGAFLRNRGRSVAAESELAGGKGRFEAKFNVEALAQQFAISNRNFIRRFKKATHNTPFEYIQRVKVEAAKKRFESSTLNITQVMYDVGYNDEKAFRKVFKKYTGLSPLDYRKKFNREMAFS